jgi:uncharacterized protein (TIGR02145 family)
MKKFTMIIFALLAILKSQAQDYLVNFTASGDTTMVSSIKVDNLTSGATLTLNGGDILHLTAILGFELREMDKNHLAVHPNPMIERAVLTFAAPEKGDAVIGIFDLSGKTVCQLSLFLSEGENCFQISGIYRGIYLLKVTGRGWSYSHKVVSQSQLRSNPEIVFVSNIKPPATKSTAAVVEMKYTNGDQLLFTGTSGRYSTIVTDEPLSNKLINFGFRLCQDNDGNHYPIVMVGGQTWMAKNLKAGSRIDGPQNQTDNGIIEKYCYSDTDPNCDIYGGLYQWNELMQYVSTEGAQGICPAGWHLPSDGEWTILTDFLGGLNVAGGKLKETGTLEAGTGSWWSPNTGAVNSSGFTALPGGYRNYAGVFLNLYALGSFWSSSLAGSSSIWARDLNRNNGVVTRYYNISSDGFSARCIRN